METAVRPLIRSPGFAVNGLASTGKIRTSLITRVNSPSFSGAAAVEQTVKPNILKIGLTEVFMMVGFLML